MNNYSLNEILKEDEAKKAPASAWKKMLPLLRGEKRGLAIAFVAVIANSGLNLAGPLVIGHAIDRYVVKGDYHGVLVSSGLLLAIYLGAFIANYIQMRVMGGVAQRTLWRLRNDLFAKLQELPLAFFAVNKTGDLISRINSDTDRLNQFFSQGLMRFAGNIFLIIGAGLFILFINWQLGVAALLPAVGIFIFTRLISRLVARRNAGSLRAGGLLSAEVQESIANFKVVLAFNRRDYFRSHFAEANQAAFRSAVGAGYVNELFTPVFEFAGNVAQLIVLGVGLYLITQGQFAIGLLVSFVLYVTRFYDPLREMARLWSTFQVALAAWDRVSRILHLSSDLAVIPASEGKKGGRGVIDFERVSFAYPGGREVLRDASFAFERGKTYALVGPTGGGKTTTASLIARLYDPTAGTVYLDGRDIRSYDPAERSKKIGFILQEPFLFSGTVRDNILYGNPGYAGLSEEALKKVLAEAGLGSLLERFKGGLSASVDASGALSLGEKQIIAFVRAVLRKPEILILDEATANIDTVTEKILEDILAKLPPTTTKVVIAHRLNTIASADDIFFVNAGEIREAGSMEHAVDMLLHHKRQS
ncbi:MAG TPA: ABC transporter ATP-binding protein [Candidatus Paceibacterota bacterium]|nr:ABC transporter ATP-binding protein [Candidatus Paceibacterota bacterium]